MLTPVVSLSVVGGRFTVSQNNIWLFKLVISRDRILCKTIQHTFTQTSATAAHRAQPSKQLLLYSHHTAQQQRDERKSEQKKAKAAIVKFFSELSWTKLIICLSCKRPMIHILPIWRCHRVKICLHEARATEAISLYHVLFLCNATSST